MALKRDKYDKAASELVRAINRHTCQKCGIQGRMEAAHIFGRRHARTRYDMDNLTCLCHSCHRYFTENPVFFFDWLIEYFGEEYIDQLRLKAWKVKKWKKGERDLIYKEMRLKLKQLETV